MLCCVVLYYSGVGENKGAADHGRHVRAKSIRLGQAWPQTPSSGLRHPSFRGRCRKTALEVWHGPRLQKETSGETYGGLLVSKDKITNHVHIIANCLHIVTSFVST